MDDLCRDITGNPGPSPDREHTAPSDHRVGIMNGRDRRLLLVAIPGALVAGGMAGAGVGLHWYGPAVGVGLAIVIGLAAGSVVLRIAIRVKRARRARGG